MKQKLILLLSAVALMMPQAMNAQEDFFFVDFHEKDNNPLLTLETKPEDIFSAILEASPDAGDIAMAEGSWFEEERRVTDDFGNVHLTYCQMFDPKAHSPYQLVLHFRHDGSLYYTNGTLVLQEKTAQNAKGQMAVSKISAENAAVIATGSSTSETVKAFANYKNKPREAYMVKDMARMQYVYVDAYSGDVLYTIPMVHSYAPWSAVNGNVANLVVKTTYNGLRDMDVMQTDGGYILRDPVRNIITVDATNALADRSHDSFQESLDEQLGLTLEDTPDVLFANEEDFRNQQYSCNLKSVTIFLDPETTKAPETVNLSVYYLDKNTNEVVEEVMDVTLNNAEWTNDNGCLKYTYVLESHPNISLYENVQVVLLTIDGEEYAQNDVIQPGSRNAVNMYQDGKMTNVKCQFDIDADVKQAAIDVHWAMQNIYDMYDEYYGLKSCDGDEAQIVNIVNPGDNIPRAKLQGMPLNACAFSNALPDCNGVPSFVMMYGMGGSGAYGPLVTFDITAHEFTHNVTGGCCNSLLYQNESGALNEALADCMAMVAEDYMFGTPTWTIAEDMTLDADNLRSCSDPWYSGCNGSEISKYGAQPKYYGGKYWIDYTTMDPNDPLSDCGGVHINSGVFNYLFYLLCEGAAGITNEKGETLEMLPVGMDKMKDIIFHDMRYFNACLCSYSEIADNLMMVIEDLYSNDDSAIHDLQNKFDTAYKHVGMTTNFVPTGITSVATDAKLPYSGIYNLFGMPVDGSYKGVVIRNGRKFIN